MAENKHSRDSLAFMCVKYFPNMGLAARDVSNISTNNTNIASPLSDSGKVAENAKPCTTLPTFAWRSKLLRYPRVDGVAKLFGIGKVARIEQLRHPVVPKLHRISKLLSYVKHIESQGWQSMYFMDSGNLAVIRFSENGKTYNHPPGNFMPNGNLAVWHKLLLHPVGQQKTHSMIKRVINAGCAVPAKSEISRGCTTLIGGKTWQI